MVLCLETPDAPEGTDLRELLLPDRAEFRRCDAGIEGRLVPAWETTLLLVSSLTFGLGMIAMHKQKVGQMYAWLALTWLLGFGFMCMEVWEFNHLIHQGYGPDHSAFLSAFFALVGTHGLHVSAGLLWLLIMFIQIKQNGLTQTNKTRMACLSLFWHFLDLIWIGVFSVVYLNGAL
ncbi:MAG: cytochrome c oxidase subunit 3 [Stenotrophomonas maltophilia]